MHPPTFEPTSAQQAELNSTCPSPSRFAVTCHNVRRWCACRCICCKYCRLLISASPRARRCWSGGCADGMRADLQTHGRRSGKLRIAGWPGQGAVRCPLAVAVPVEFAPTTQPGPPAPESRYIVLAPSAVMGSCLHYLHHFMEKSFLHLCTLRTRISLQQKTLRTDETGPVRSLSPPRPRPVCLTLTQSARHVTVSRSVWRLQSHAHAHMSVSSS